MPDATSIGANELVSQAVGGTNTPTAAASRLRGSSLRFAGGWHTWTVRKMVNHPKWDPCFKPTLDAANFGSECIKNEGPCAGLRDEVVDMLTDMYKKGVTM